MHCRDNCGACCIAPSISSLKKPAGVRCEYLNEQYRCTIFNQPNRPQACSGFQAEALFCGNNRVEAIQILTLLESETT